MFDVFGEFDSMEELNMAAEGQRKQGDKESFLNLAKENGIDEYEAELYWSGQTSVLVDYFSAAVGKLEIEKANIKSRMPVAPIVDFLSSSCLEESFARIIRSKVKNLNDCIDLVYKKCQEECKKSGGYVADMTVFNWAREYYTEV